MYDKKIAIIIEKDLLPWQKLNVVSFLASSVAIRYPETHGENFITAENIKFLPFFKTPDFNIYGRDNRKTKASIFARD